MNKIIFVVLDNIRSKENVGSIFRTSDAVGVGKIYLCGITPKPLVSQTRYIYQKGPVDKISKAALGAEKYMPWEYCKQTWRILKKLKKEGVQIIALEQAKDAVNYKKFRPKFPFALILGNEVKGLSKDILKYADRVIKIPMYGKKESLNVAVAFGIAVYQIGT